MKNLKDPTTFNYAVTCTAFNLETKPRAFLVDYQASKFGIQKRLPGGRFQPKDILNVVGEILNHERNLELEFFCGHVMSLDQKHQAKTLDVDDFVILNQHFNELTRDLLLELQKCKINDELFRRIVQGTHHQTVRRELKEEIKASRVGKLFLTSVSNGDEHYKLGYVSVDVDAPPIYTGSPDRKVLKSKLVDVDEWTEHELFNGHSNNFQEAIREILDNDLHKNAKLLKPLLSASR